MLTTGRTLLALGLMLLSLNALIRADEKPDATKDAEAKIKSALAKLSDEDRASAVAQRYCAVEPENRLGSMGPPAKVVLNGQAVWLCCDGCDEEAQAHPNDVLKRVQGMKKFTAALMKMPAADRPLAEQQRFCAVLTKNWLGSMGAPVKLTIKGQPVFLCCEGCRDRALANPDKTLTNVAELKAVNSPSKPDEKK